MGAVSYLRDRLINVMSGMGTTADKRTASFYAFMRVDPVQVEAAYRTDWLHRKIVDIPPFDMTREWRRWQAEATDIETIEAEEKRLGLRAKAQRALVLARLFGGGALLLGTGDGDPTQPINPDSVKLGGLKYIHVLSRHQLSVGQAVLDLESEWFGQPSYYELGYGQGGQSGVQIHPSRVVPFIGQKTPEGSHIQSGDWFWGDPIMQSIEDAVKNAGIAQTGFAALIDEAKLDIIKIPGMMAGVGTAEYETRLMNRLGAANAGKSTWRALLIDGEEDWQQHQVTWAGMPEMMMAYLDIVAGAADIPMTRLLGQSPRGLQSTGDGEERDYHAMIHARQNELLAPALDLIDPLLIRSALGSYPPDVYYEFAPLAQSTPKEDADIETAYATTAKTYADSGLIQTDALAEMVKNGIIERGQWPGSETAFENAKMPLVDPNALPDPALDPNVDPSAWTQPVKPPLKSKAPPPARA